MPVKRNNINSIPLFCAVKDGCFIPLEIKEISMTMSIDDAFDVSISGSIPWRGGVCSDRYKSPIEKVIFNDPATIVFWIDGTKTVVKCQPGDTFDKHTGLAMAIAKKYLGNLGRYYNIFKEYIDECK